MVRSFLVILFCAFFSCEGTSEDFEQKPKKFMKPCFNEDELLNLCTDPIEICHEERTHEIKLVRIEGVKVCNLMNGYHDFCSSVVRMDSPLMQGR